MPGYCYVKKYSKNQYGGSVLRNPEPLTVYNQSRYDMLLASHGDRVAQRKVKLQILSEFVEIFNFDCEHAVYPEPFGYFADDEEKAEFRRIHLLHLNFINYLGSIFAGYHTDIARSGHVEMPELSNYVVDFKEVFNAAYLDYACALLGIQKNVRIYVPGESEEIAKPIIEDSVTYAGDIVQVPGAEKGKKTVRAPHAVVATYIYPALIEQALTQYLENSILYKWLEGTEKGLSDGSIILNEKEEILFTCHKQIRDAGSGKVSGSRRRMLQTIWNIGEKHGILKDCGGMKSVMYGKHGGDELALGDMLGLSYSATQIRPEYLAVLRLLFGRKNINLRNMIAHGDRSTFDYLHIGYVAIMHQLLLDVATDDVFFMKGRYAQ
mgnify:CR=1 FL=1